MSITDAGAYCRQNYASLASIHSYAEQQQAVSVCASMRTGDEGEGAATVAGDTAAGGGYGCWIGFEDSSSEGGFIWTDGSNTDFVAFAPGEPNGGGGESAVAIDLRGHMGAYTGLLRNGCG